MAQVNVPDQKVPDILFELMDSPNNELSALATALIEYFERDIFFEWQMWKRSGGSSDRVDLIVSSDSFENSFSNSESMEEVNALKGIEDLIPISEDLEYSDVKTGVYTAVNGDWVESRGGDITLDPNANTGDLITVSIGSNERTTIRADKIKWKGRILDCVESSRVGNSYSFKRFSYKDDNYWLAV